MKNKLDLFIAVILFCFSSVNAGAKLKKGEELTEESYFPGLSEVNDDIEYDDLDMPIKIDNYTLGCKKIRSSPLHEIRTATYTQFPFMAIVMSHLNKYLCSGVIISNGLILTTARCATAYEIYVLLNATQGKFDDTTIMLQVNRTEVFPSFIGFRVQLDIGLIYTEPYNCTVCTKIRLSNHTYKSIYDVNGLEAVGYGLNTGTDKRKDMQYIGMNLRQPVEDLEILSAYFDCFDTKVPTCFRDTGSAVILDNELVGIVDTGTKECSKQMLARKPSNKRLATIVPSYTFKAWVSERIENNEPTPANNSVAPIPEKQDALSE